MLSSSLGFGGLLKKQYFCNRVGGSLASEYCIPRQWRVLKYIFFVSTKRNNALERLDDFQTPNAFLCSLEVIARLSMHSEKIFE